MSPAQFQTCALTQVRSFLWSRNSSRRMIRHRSVPLRQVESSMRPANGAVGRAPSHSLADSYFEEPESPSAARTLTAVRPRALARECRTPPSPRIGIPRVSARFRDEACVQVAGPGKVGQSPETRRNGHRACILLRGVKAWLAGRPHPRVRVGSGSAGRRGEESTGRFEPAPSVVSLK